MASRTQLLLLLPFLCQAQDADRDQRWIQDADYLSQQILTNHPNPFTQHSREQFFAALDSLKSSIPRLRDYEVIAGLAKLAAMAGDAHTSLNVNAGAQGSGVEVRWFTDGLWITGGGATTARYIGQRIAAINRIPTEEVFARLKPYLSHENESWARYRSTGPILSPQVLAAIGVMSAPGDVPVTLEDRQGGQGEAMLPAGGSVLIYGPHVSRPLNPLWRRNPTLFYWVAYLEESSTLYIKYNMCNESPALPMTEFARDLAALAVEKQPARMIIDVRDNPGGGSQWLGVMLKDLLAAAESGRLRQPQEGAYVIISKATFSSGTLAAMDLRAMGGITVGEPSGGNPTGFGPTISFTLPNSRIAGSVSRGWVQFPGWGQQPVPAAIAVDFSSAAFFADADPYLEAALKALPSASPQGMAAGAGFLQTSRTRSQNRAVAASPSAPPARNAASGPN